MKFVLRVSIVVGCKFVLKGVETVSNFIDNFTTVR